MKFDFLAKFSKVVVGNVVAALIFAVFFLLAAKNLENQEFGIFAILYTLSLLLADLADFGTGAFSLTNEEFPKNSTKINRFKKLSGSRLTFFICTLPLILLTFIINKELLLSLTSVVMCSYTMSIRILLQTNFRAESKYTHLAISQVFDRLISLVFFILLHPTSAEGVLFCVTLSNLLLLIIFRWKPEISLDLNSLKSNYMTSRKLGISSIASDLALLDIVLLATLSNADAVAKYSLVSRFCAPILLIGASVALVVVKEMQPTISSRSVLLRNLRKVLILTFILGASFSILILFTSDLIMRFFLHDKYSSTFWLLAVALLGSLFSVLWQSVAAVFQAHKMYELNLRITLQIAGAYLASILLLTSHLNEFALPTSQGIVFLVSILLSILFLFKNPESRFK
jgi:O-antigen/teichoic acid export membrane protein